MMRFFGPKHTYEDVLRLLVEGLENGTLTLDELEEAAGQQPPQPLPGPKGLPLWVVASFSLAGVATFGVSAICWAAHQPLPWSFPVACFVACFVCTAVAFRLGTGTAPRRTATNRDVVAPSLPALRPEQRTAGE